MPDTVTHRMKKVIYFNHTSALGGSGWCLYQMVKGLPEGVTDPVVVLPEEGGLSVAFHDLGVKVILDPSVRPLLGNSNSRNMWRWSSIRSVLSGYKAPNACQRICEEQKPDVVHLNSSVLFHLAEGAKRAGVEKVVLHVREHWVVKKWDPREWLKCRKLPAFVDELIAISKTSAQLFGYEQRTKVIYDWPEFEGRDESVDMKAEYHISAEKKVILLPGGRHSIKGSLTVIHAMEFVEDADAVVLLLGAVCDRHPLKVLVRKCLKRLHIQTYGLRLDAAVENLGNRACSAATTKNIKSVIAQSCMVISPFTTPHFSMPSIEAGLLHKPVIISGNGHARETVVDGESGYIVPAGDARGFAEAINRLLADQALRQKMGDAGHEYVTHKFDREASMKKLMDVYGR